MEEMKINAAKKLLDNVFNDLNRQVNEAYHRQRERLEKQYQHVRMSKTDIQIVALKQLPKIKKKELMDNILLPHLEYELSRNVFANRGYSFMVDFQSFLLSLPQVEELAVKSGRNKSRCEIVREELSKCYYENWEIEMKRCLENAKCFCENIDLCLTARNHKELIQDFVDNGNSHAQKVVTRFKEIVQKGVETLEC